MKLGKYLMTKRFLVFIYAIMIVLLFRGMWLYYQMEQVKFRPPTNLAGIPYLGRFFFNYWFGMEKCEEKNHVGQNELGQLAALIKKKGQGGATEMLHTLQKIKPSITNHIPTKLSTTTLSTPTLPLSPTVSRVHPT